MEIIFKERQRLDAIWPMLFVAIVVVSNYIYYFIFHNNEMELFYNSLLMAIIVGGVLSILRLDYAISKTEIRFKFFPIHFKWQKILWENVSSVQIRKYNALSEYYGRGIKSSVLSGKAYSISGHEGLQVTLKNGKKILFGTNKSLALKKYLVGINKL